MFTKKKTDDQQGADYSNISTEEASLIWDEYKYRHDLIWRHLVRSTLAVAALVTIGFSTDFKKNEVLFSVAAILAVIYTVFSFVVLNRELELLVEIRGLHRQRQRDRYGLQHGLGTPERQDLEKGFSLRARVYLAGLLLLALAAALAQILR